MILAVDPGPERSAYCLLDPLGVPLAFGIDDTERMVLRVRDQGKLSDVVAIEMIASYGMPVGAEVFETCVNIGRFMQATGAPGEVELIKRMTVKDHLCHSSKANDSTIRQALLDRFGGKEKAVGNKKAPGPLYGMKADMWAALAVAVTAHDQAQKPAP